MKVLLFFNAVQLGNHLHPFLISELNILCAEFKEVHLFCLEPQCGWEETKQYRNLFIHSRTDKDFIINSYCFFTQFFTGGIQEDFHAALHDHKVDISYIKETLKIVVPGYIMAKKAKKFLKNIDTENWVSISYWFAGTAYAASLVNSWYPEIPALTRAHSSEVDTIRNPYCKYSLKKYMIEHLKTICFISEAGRNVYRHEILPLYKDNSSDVPKCEIVRLGTLKKRDELNKPSLDSIFRIVSCSRAVELKRLDLLARSLIKIKDREIIWTHFGDGPCMPEVKEIMKISNDNITFFWTGCVENEDIHEYYLNNPVDCFVNVSQFEGIPVSVMEALSYGIPVLATNAGGTRELINETNGLLIDVNIKEDELFSILIKMIDRLNKTEIASEIRSNAYQTWRDKCDFHVNAKQYLKIISSNTLQVGN